MNWLTDPLQPAPALPAVWLVETSMMPRNQSERSQVRRKIAARVVATQLCRPEGDIEIGHDAHGRPLIAGCGELHLSYAVRGSLAVVALAATRVGADVEQVVPLPDLPWNVLHPLEQASLRALVGTARDALFYQIWTAKEAVLKGLGKGLMQEPSALSVLPDEQGHVLYDGQRVTVWTRCLECGGHSFAVAVCHQAEGE